jgi:sugar phosphate isomerase/epimerase
MLETSDANARLFESVDLGAIEGWAHVQPSQLAADVARETDRVRRALDRAGLRALALNAGTGDADRDAQRARVSALVKLAERLGCGSVALQAPAAGATVDEAVAALAPVTEVAATTSVLISLEIHRDRITELPSDAIAIAERTGLGLTLDPSHVIAGPARADGFDELLPYVAHLHVRDTRPDALEVTIGEGELPFDAIFAGLVAQGYDGVVTVEYIEGNASTSIDDDLVRAGRFVCDRWPGEVLGAAGLRGTAR